MNGVMMPSVSAGSSHREARVMCTPQVMVPSGAALTGLTAPSVTAMMSIARKVRQYGTVMTSPSWTQGGHFRGNIWLRASCSGDRQTVKTPAAGESSEHDLGRWVGAPL